MQQKLVHVPPRLLLLVGTARHSFTCTHLRNVATAHSPIPSLSAVSPAGVANYKAKPNARLVPADNMGGLT
jgi:hypothetical protein